MKMRNLIFWIFVFLGQSVWAEICFELRSSKSGKSASSDWQTINLFGESRPAIPYRDFPVKIDQKPDTVELWSPFETSGLRIHTALGVYFSRNSDSDGPYGRELFMGVLDHARLLNRRVLVLGSGSGHLAFLAWQAGARYVLGLEISKKAFPLSIKNRDALGLTENQVHFLKSDLFSSFEEESVAPQFDVILFNAPRALNRDLLRQSKPSLDGIEAFSIMKISSYSEDLFDVPGELLRRYMSEVHRYLRKDGSFFLMNDIGIEDYFSSFENLNGIAIRGPWDWSPQNPDGIGQYAIFQFRRPH